VCPYCDEGSGTILDSRLGTLKICQACEGTGLRAESSDQLQARINLAAKRHGGNSHVA
jgi:hypothetical protein